MKKNLLFFAIIVVCVAAILAWANDSSVSSRPLPVSENSHENADARMRRCGDCNVIMISLSNVSAEHMSLYGYERITTPNLDAWAKDAIVFENAFTQSSWTLPVGVSLFTSLYPYAHGVLDRHTNNVLSKDVKTLPEILKKNGYATAAFTGGLDYSKTFGHMRGFDTVIEEGEEVDWPTDFAGLSAAFVRAQEWLKKQKENKFFLFVHGYDTHCPFIPPEKFAGAFSKNNDAITIDTSQCLRGYRNSETETYEAYYFKNGQQKTVLTNNDIQYLEDSYDEEILSADDLTVKFLQDIEKQVLDKTIIVVFSDHGEMFAKHGRFGRAGAIRGTLYDDVLHIPLMIKIPGVKGKQISGLAQIIDVMPTLLDVLGIVEEKQLQGMNLIPLITGKEKNINDFIFAGTRFGVGLRNFVYTEDSINEAIRNKKWKLIHEIIFEKEEDERIETETYELYDIENDPNELNNIAHKEEKAFNDLKARMREISQNIRIMAPRAETDEVSDDLINEARKRGYW